jgi:ketosteroid isomerase-like protein
VEEGHDEATLDLFLSFCRKGKLMHTKQIVADMADEVLARQAQAHAKQTGEAFEDALESVLRTEAGRQLRDLRDGPHGCTIASQWQGDLIRRRRRQRVRAAWKLYKLMEAEQRELELQKERHLV